MTGRRRFPDVGDPQDPNGFLALRARFLESLRIANRSPLTVETVSARLRPFLLWCSLKGLAAPAHVTREHLAGFQEWLFRYRKEDGMPLDFGTQRLQLGAIKLFFKWLVRAGILLFSPAADIEYPRTGYRLPRSVLSHAEVERTMAGADVGTVLGLRDRVVLEVLYSTGVRRIEIEGLHLGDVHWDAGSLFIRKAKGDRQRVVPLGARALAWLERYLSVARPALSTRQSEQALFLNKKGLPLSRRAVSVLARKLLRRADLTKAGAAHVFRHTAATVMLEGGADVRYVQELLGHASLLSTQVYTRVAIVKLKEVHAATHPGARLSAEAGPPPGTPARNGVRRPSPPGPNRV